MTKRFLSGEWMPWKMKSSQGKLRPLPEDYVTSLYPVKEGVWIGFRNQVPILLNPANMQYESSVNTKLAEKKKGGTVSCFVDLPDGTVLAGVFGEGFRVVGKQQPVKRKDVVLEMKSNIQKFFPFQMIRHGIIL